jgi:hypothetical protein
VVTVADDELFGADGTQPLPASPALPDPLGGLVTGYLFSDNTAGPLVPIAEQQAAQVNAVAAEVRRRATAPVTGRRSSAPGAVTPDAIAPAESLPSRQRETRRPTAPRPTANRATQVPVAPAVNRRPAATRPTAPAASAQAAGRNPAMSRPAPGMQPRRSGGGGCAVMVVVIVLVVVVFVVLGVVLGHGSSGFFGG